MMVNTDFLPQDKPIKSLGSLPGGKQNYLRALTRILQWLNATRNATRDLFIHWVAQEYDISEKSAVNYWHVISRLQVLDASSSGRIKISKFGETLLKSSPIDQALLLSQKLLLEYKAFAETFELYVRAEKAIHLRDVQAELQDHFPEWRSDSLFEERVLWLSSLGCIRATDKRVYAITEFGKQVAKTFSTQSQSTTSQIDIGHPTGNYLINELRESARDSSIPNRLEKAVSDAFEFLGFVTTPIGGAGDTDVLLEAFVLNADYTVIVDAKARGDGKLSNLDTDKISDHRKKNDADFAVIVAESFSAGSLLNRAKSREIVLLPIDVLCDWIALHCVTPLNIHEYRAVFEHDGLLEDLPVSIQQESSRRHDWCRLIAETIKLLQANYRRKLAINQSVESLHTALAIHLGEMQYDENELLELTYLFTHPAICAAIGDRDDMRLAMNTNTLVHTLRALADEIERQ